MNNLRKTLNRNFKGKNLKKFLLSVQTTITGMFFLLALNGCASFGSQLKEFLSGSEEKIQPPAEKSYSDNSQQPAVQRTYQRMTAEKMKQEAGLGEKAGSLWTMEGQGAYLFAQNNSRLIGDYLSVQIDGGPKKQLEAKTKVIKDLLDQFEKQRLAELQVGEGDAASANPSSPPAPAPTQAQNNQSQRTPSSEGNAQGAEPSLFSVPMVATRVTDKTKDGNYRIQGEQPYMIGSREYKLVVQGTVRPEDFNEAGVSSEKLLDPHFDIVSK